MREDERLALGRPGPGLYDRALEAAAAADRRVHEEAPTVVRATDQVWENSAHGLLKHMVNASIESAEQCLDVYQQVIAPGGHSGRHRHFSEEIVFILEGSGYDLHWDPVLRAEQRYEWGWEPEPKRFEWQAGDFVYIPPYVTHQHFASPAGRVRLISATSRIVRAMGFDGLEQIEPASDPSGTDLTVPVIA